LTDIHAGPFISFDTIAEIVTKTNGLKPDLIVMTGDYINHNPNYIDGCLQILDELKAPGGVLGVYGNHDYYTGIAAMREAFGKTQISILSDSHGVAKGLEGLLNIIGADDPVSGWATDARFRNLTQVSRLVRPERFNLLLSHRPGIFSICQDWNVDLTLAGHTHGGQVILPGIGSRGLSLAGPFLSYTHGLYEAEQDPEVRMYLSRGLGTIVAPVRLFCKPEIVEITLVEA
jgi:predicted MPP superfamily phosphohydrolase